MTYNILDDYLFYNMLRQPSQENSNERTSLIYGDYFTYPVQTVVDLANIIVCLAAVITVTATIIVMRRDAARNRERDKIERETQELRERSEELHRRKSIVRQRHDDYLKICLDNPELSMGIYDPEDKVSEDRYDTFVTMLLNLYDEALVVDEKRFTIPFEYQVMLHEKYLRLILHRNNEQRLNFRSSWSPTLLTHADRVFDKLDADRATTSAGSQI